MPKTILCIDDDRRVFSELLAGLENDDHRLLYTDDLDEALQIAVDGQLDLIMMEILLSQGDGLDWVEEIRATGNGRSKIPIVIVTAADRTPKLYGRAVELGVADYLTKPVLQSQLIACVREVADAEDVLAPLDIAEPTAAADFDHSELDLIELDDPELDLPDKGKLAELPLPEVLDRLHHAARTGVLVVEGRRGRKKTRTGVQLRNGSPVAVSLGKDAESLEDFLVRTGRLSEEDLDEALDEMESDSFSVQEALIDMGLMSEDAYEAAVRARCEEELFNLFRIEKGRYRFEEGRRMSAERALDVERSAGSIIVEGVLAWSPLDSVRAALSRHPDLYVAESVRPVPRYDEVDLSEDELHFVRGLMGDRSIADFLESSELEQRMLYAFSVAGIIDLCLDQVLVLDDALTPLAGDPMAVPEIDEPAFEEAEDATEPPEKSEEALEPRPARPARVSKGRKRSRRIEVAQPELFDDSREPAPTHAPVEASPLAESSRAAESVEVGESAAESAEPAELRGPLEPPDSFEPHEVSDSSAAAELAEPEETPEPSEVTESFEVAEPPEVAEPAEVAESSEVAESPEAAETADVTPSGELARIPRPPRPAPSKPHHQLLGEDAHDSDGAWQAAYRKRLANLPFERVKADEAELNALAKRVRTRLDRAFGNLGDPGTRTATGAEGAQPVGPGGPQEEEDRRQAPEPAERALDAETWFRRGEGFLKAKRYEKALEAFGMCAHLDPTAGEYIAHLGYALYLSNPNDELVRKEALEDIARGIKLSPESDTPYLFLGRIFKVMGEIENARKMFKRALTLRPHCLAAAQELRVIDLREKKKGAGLLKRLLDR